MKAKYFKKIRAKCQYYQVQTSESLFGRFPNNWDSGKVVLAKNAEHACYRAKRRGYGLTKEVGDYTTENWGRWRVKILGKSNNYRHIVYF
jgi:hypothetical protein